MMGSIKGRDTKPEMTIRRLLWGLGYRYRLHLKGLPGRPDLVFQSRRAVVFVHGCFWHRHNCGLAYEPKTRPEFWTTKFARNIDRDLENLRDLHLLGWRTFVVWECEISRDDDLKRRLVKFLECAPS